MQRLIRPSWQIVCHANDIANAGDWRTLEILGESIVVIRGDDGQARAFANVCRHRGSRLVDGEASNIKKPLMLHIAAKDQFVPPEAQKKILDGLGKNPLVTLHVYQEMDHAFARIGGAHYDKACADLANGRTSTFFRQHLS